jgi:hypothetical protein
MALAAFIAGHVHETEQSAIADHLRRCDWCAAACEDARAWSSGAIPVPDAPHYVVTAAMALVQPRPVALRLTLWSLRAAAALGVAASGFLVGRAMTPQPAAADVEHATAAFGFVAESAGDDFFTLILSEAEEGES